MKNIYEKTKNRLQTRRKNEAIFYYLILFLPLLQFAIFYIGVNLNSILLAFKKYTLDPETNLATKVQYAGFDNFRQIIMLFRNEEVMWLSVKNSVLLWVGGVILGTPLGLLFSFYVYKKMFLSKTFRVILFLPSIISSVVTILLFKYFTEVALPTVAKNCFGLEMKGLLSTPDKIFPTIFLFTLWTGFGTSTMLYAGAMNSINEPVVEACKIDGANAIQEFFNVTLPSVYPTLVTFMVSGVAGIFVNQMGLFSFFGVQAEKQSWTIGYYLYRETISSTSSAGYPFLAAFGVVLTIITVPITYLIKFLMERFGPSND